MANKTAVANRFLEFHNHLKATDSEKFATCLQQICVQLGISETSYYRKLRNPTNNLSIAEKNAIAGVYQLPAHFIFPELEEIN